MKIRQQRYIFKYEWQKRTKTAKTKMKDRMKTKDIKKDENKHVDEDKKCQKTNIKIHWEKFKIKIIPKYWKLQILGVKSEHIQ